LGAAQVKSIILGCSIMSAVKYGGAGKLGYPISNPELEGFPTADPTKMTFHLMGLAHTKTTKDFSHCAYTQKVYKIGKMLTDLGHTVYHYGAEGSNLQCTEHIDCISDAEQAYCYESRGWPCTFFDPDFNDFAYKRMNERAIKEINERKQPHDILLCSMGVAQKPIADRVGLVAVEMGIGYTGVFAKYRVFESYAWMAYLYGMLYPNPGSCDGFNYDAVIPNYFDPDDFELSEDKDEYLLYMGRVIARKGVNVAYEVAKKTGRKLIIAGQGLLRDVGIPANDSIVEHVGPVGPAQRSNLMKKAHAILVPTIYFEPFGGVNVEAMFCGTPAITTDYGGFTETVDHGRTGYRCHTLEQFCWAVEHTHELCDAKYLRDYAINNYSIERVGKMYNEYLSQVSGLFGKGWYEDNPTRTELNWLKRWH